MPSYKVEFFDKLVNNLRKLEKELTVTEHGGVDKTVRNTCLFARALHNTFKDVGDVAGILVMNAACDYSPIEQTKVEG